MPRPRWGRPCSNVSGPLTCSSTPRASTCRNEVSGRLPSTTGTRFLQPISTAPITACARFFPGCASGGPARSSTSTPTSARWRGRFRSRLCGVEVRSAGPHAADQCRGTRERRAGLFICPRDVNTPLLDKRLQPPARRFARPCCSPTISPPACGSSRRSRRAQSWTRFRCLPVSA